MKYKIIETAESGFFVKKRFLLFFWIPMLETEFERSHGGNTVTGNHKIWYSYKTQGAAENAIAHDERYPLIRNGHKVAYGNNMYVDLSSSKRINGETHYERWGRSIAYLERQIDEFDVKQLKKKLK